MKSFLRALPQFARMLARLIGVWLIVRDSGDANPLPVMPKNSSVLAKYCAPTEVAVLTAVAGL